MRQIFLASLLACFTACAQGAGGEDPLALGVYDGGELGFACPKGAINLAERSRRKGFTNVVLGAIDLHDDGHTVFDEVDFNGDKRADPIAIGDREFTLCVPNNTVSFVVQADDRTVFPEHQHARSIFTSFVNPSGENLIATTKNSQYLFSEARPSFDSTQAVSSIAYPKSPEHAPVGGIFRVRVGASTHTEQGARRPAEKVNVSIAIRRGAETAQPKLPLRVTVVRGSDLTPGDIRFLEENTPNELNRIFAQSSLRIDEDRFAIDYIEEDGLAELTARREDVLNLTGKSTVDKHGQPSPVSDDDTTLHVYIVSEVLDEKSGSVIFALASGIPGAVGFPTSAGSGVFMSAQAMRMGARSLYRPLVYLAMAHEIGHWLGLHHTTERTGHVSDPLPDTPSCPPQHDTRGAPGGADGLVTASECSSQDGKNLMFWNADGTSLSEGQNAILAWNPILVAS